MKWIFLAIAITAVIPLVGWLRNNSRETPKIWMVVGFLVIQHGPLHAYMAMISWAGKWPAYTYGAEISLLDLIVLGIFLSLPRRQHPLPFKFPIGFYFFAVILSVYQASVPEAALFYAWQLARIFFIYIVISTASAQDPRVSPALLKGMAFGLILGLCEALWERFGLGILRTHGGFSHENFFGVVSHFVVYPFFALLLAGERGWLAPVISLAGIIIAALTASRATFALAVFGYGVVFIASAMRGWNSRKTKVAAISFIAVLAVAPLVVSSFQDRFQSGAVNAFFGTDEARVAMARAASMILADHPMGVGPNHFIVVANTGGYYSQVETSVDRFPRLCSQCLLACCCRVRLSWNYFLCNALAKPLDCCVSMRLAKS